MTIRAMMMRMTRLTMSAMKRKMIGVMALTKVTTVNMKLTCQTIVREEAATAYTKYLPMRKDISTQV